MSKQATTTKTERAIINPGENPYQYGQALPISPPDQPPITEMDWRKVEPPPLFKLRPSSGAAAVRQLRSRGNHASFG